ncbi:uncharacterized protein LOC125477104 [Pyrus x bretschneideri]|uniref:uncharacterized protein LOC125477104 n=1 Tax=Pyrus x bretschneideri TaxID=225117 RepID=UPI00202F629F|nr:uncharacterized protein LOC125477104 [Pyrus x bretschneideri]
MKQQIEMHLGMLEFSIAFTQPQPTALTETSTAAEKETFAKWERANQMSLLVMQNLMEEHIRCGIQNCDLAKQYIAKIEEKYKRSNKAETGVYLSDLINAKFDGNGSVREHLLKLVNLSNKLNAMDVAIADQFLVHLALYSLPNEYEQLKVSYNTQKQTWDINELISICCQEEERMKKSKHDTVNLVQYGKGKGKVFGPSKPAALKIGKAATKSGSPYLGSKKHASNSVIPIKSDLASTSTGLRFNKINLKKCHLCGSTEHLRKDCAGFKAWLIKKGIAVINLFVTT